MSNFSTTFLAGVICALAGCLFLAACVGGYSSHAGADDRSATHHRPVAVTFKREISGEIFGKALKHPVSPRVDARGNITFIDQGNQRLIQLDKSLKPITKRGGLGSQRGEFQLPVALAVNDSYIFVADYDLDLIQRFDPNLNPVDAIQFDDPENPLRFGRPAGIEIDSDGNLWVSDDERSRIAVFDRFLDFKDFFADYNSGGLRLGEPGAIAKAGLNLMGVTESERGRIHLLDLYGTERLRFGEGELESPSALAVDVYGLIWVSDKSVNEFFCYSAGGELLYRSSQQAGGDEFRLKAPQGICLPDSSTLLVADSEHNRLLVYEVVFSTPS
ncbi:MAG: NHL repeat-containing protein [Candidatus Zixiibacteriota bacterium]